MIERRDGISDADFEIHLRFRELFDEVATDHVVVDNSGTEAETAAQVDAAFGEGPAGDDRSDENASNGDAAADGRDRSAAVTDAE